MISTLANVGAAPPATAAEVVVYSSRHYGQETAFDAFTKKTGIIEYPANPQAAIHPIVVKWGKFRQDDINIAAAGEFQAAAVKLADRADYK